MRWFVVIGLIAGVALRVSAAPGPATCLRISGDAGRRCLDDYLTEIEACRLHQDAPCETAARADGGTLDMILARPEAPSRKHCTEASADTLGYLGIEDLVFRIPEACTDFAEDLLRSTFAADVDSLPPAALGCQGSVIRGVRRLRMTVVQAFGRECFVTAFAGGRCDRKRRDRKVTKARAWARKQILRRCGAEFDGLGLVPLGAGATLEERVDALLAVVVDRGRHFAERVYPPNNLGPTAEFGSFPVGVRTLTLSDPARLNVQGTGPRPLTVELYYPSTAAAVAGVPEDVVRVLGLDIVATPAFRGVARAPGRFPLVLFSHGNNGIRFQSFFFVAQLASHGFIVAAPDHHGNTFVDSLLGIVDPSSAMNRPRDVSVLIDQLLAFNAEPGNFLEGAIDPGKVGVSGHSFGGYTVFTLAGGSFSLGTFTDPRVKAIFPQAPFTEIFPDEFFASVTVPTLIVGGSLDETTPFSEEQQRPFDHLPTGAAVVGLADLIGAGHFTFSDFCEVPRNLLAFLGGFDEACEPRHLPWRHAHDIVNFLGLNFFDAVLNGNPDALARLAPARLARIEDLAYQSK